MNSHYSSFLEKLRLPQPSLQRLAVIALFKKLRSSDPDSGEARDAISSCLLSPSPPVADQAVRELCRLAVDGRISASAALLDLHAALEACPPRLVPLLVKAVGFLCRYRFRSDPQWGRRFDPLELHPFVKVLSCREEVQIELIQQVLLFIVYNRTMGIVPVTTFLRPFLMYSVIRKPFSISSSMYTRDLISSIASLSCSSSPDAISILKLLSECLKYFPCTTKEDFKCLIGSVESVVNAFVVVLKQIVRADMKLTNDAQSCGMDILDTLLSLCAYRHNPQIEVEVVLDLSKRLLVAHRDVGLEYFHGFGMVIVSLSGILCQLEFEHEHLSILKLLIFLIDWRTENDYSAGGAAYFLNEELLFIFPVISLLSSPSGSVKAAAAYLLSAVERLFPDSLDVQEKKKFSEAEFLHMSKPVSISFKLLHRLWFQVWSSSRSTRCSSRSTRCWSLSRITTPGRRSRASRGLESTSFLFTFVVSFSTYMLYTCRGLYMCFPRFVLVGSCVYSFGTLSVIYVYNFTFRLWDVYEPMLALCCCCCCCCHVVISMLISY